MSLAPKIYTAWLPRETMGQRIRRLRKNKGLTQYELADKADTARNMLSMIECDNAHPSLRSLYKIAQALEIDLGEMLKECDFPVLSQKETETL